MILGINSDHTQWWMYQFRKGEGDYILEFNQHGGMSRREILNYLQRLGYQVPQHGIVKDIVPTIIETAKLEWGLVDEELISLSTDIEAAKNDTNKQLDLAARKLQKELFDQHTRFVVYTDETKHRGEGKELLNGADALAKYPDLYCSQYIPTTVDNGSLSRRVLSIGDIGFILEYHSKDDWRSNYGDVEVAVTHRFTAPRDSKLPFPMWAIDFVGQTHVAVDFNTAPGLDAIKDYITATEIYDAVYKFIEQTKR